MKNSWTHLHPTTKSRNSEQTSFCARNSEQSLNITENSEHKNWNRENDKFNEKWNNISVVIWFKKSITWYIYLKCSESVQNFQSMFRICSECSEFSVMFRICSAFFSQCSEFSVTLHFLWKIIKFEQMILLFQNC
jgi:hypothetical protein